jgi:DNA mismatch repair protein MutL
MVLKVAKLSEEVINQIAAGEVVENPSSIIKELLENSLDAGARLIEIMIEAGGTSLIRVEDDGCGMSRGDAELSIERYATSKIRFAEDLHSLQTMGFRGEALAAIAAVSQFELKTNDGSIGTSIQVDGGRLLAVQPCARNQGTTVEVRSLFFNTPARKKFLKSIAANTALVTRVVETAMLSHPEVAFTFISQGKVVLKAAAEEWKKRVERILGCMSLEIASAPIHGLLSLPSMAKSHRREQFLFINQRPIFSPLISRAVKMGYGTRLAEDSYPCFALFLTVSPDEIDVNVHPQKKEVRFSDERKIFKLFEEAVHSSFKEELKTFSSPLTFTNPTFSFAEEPVFPSFSFKTNDSNLHFEIPERPLAVVDHFLFLQKEGFLLIDLQAVHARVLFESFQQKRRDFQNLLHPIQLELDSEMEVEELSELGIECRWIGKGTVAIDALPYWLEPSSFDQFFSSWQKGRKIEDAALKYCRSLKKRYTMDEAIDLWKALQNCREKTLDPHLKPIWVQLQKQQLEKLFL